jgi:hypothetical protein
MSVSRSEVKSFPLWFQGEKNSNYSDEYVRCLGNIKDDNTINSTSTIPNPVGSVSYRGGVLGPNGKIYMAPSFGAVVTVLDTNDHTTYTIPFTGGAASYNYVGGVLASNGKIYFTPSQATQILVIDTSDDSVSYIGSLVGPAYKWNCSVMVGDIIYMAPYSSTQVLKVDTTNDTTSLFDSISGIYKYTSAQLAFNGKIYCIAGHALNVLVIDPSDDSTYTIGSLGGGGDKYWGSTINDNGIIYSLAYQETDVLKVDTNTDIVTEINTGEVTQLFLSQCLGHNGKIYALPANGNKVAVYDMDTETLSYLSGISSYPSFGTILAPNGNMYGIIHTTSNPIEYLEGVEKPDKDLVLSRFNNKF